MLGDLESFEETKNKENIVLKLFFLKLLQISFCFKA